MPPFCLRRVSTFLLVMFCALAISSEVSAGKLLQSVQEKTPEAAFIEAKNSAALAKEWGIRLIGIQLTAAGHMLDFRFQVLNAQKASELLDRKNKPLAIVEGAKAKLEVPNAPFIGSLRQSSNNTKEGTVFTVLFGNPGKIVAQGQPVNIQIGRFAVKGVKVGVLLNPMTKIKKPVRKIAGHG